MKKHFFSAMVALGITIAFIVVIYDITNASKSTFHNTDLEKITAQNETVILDDNAVD